MAKKKREFYRPINEESIEQLFTSRNWAWGDGSETWSGQIWIKLEKPLANPSEEAYKYRDAINRSLYVSDDPSVSGNASVREGSWWDMYIEVEDLSTETIKDMLLSLNESVDYEDAGLTENTIGFNTYGQTFDLEKTSSDDGEEYAKGGQTSGWFTGELSFLNW